MDDLTRTGPSFSSAHVIVDGHGSVVGAEGHRPETIRALVEPSAQPLVQLMLTRARRGGTVEIACESDGGTGRLVLQALPAGNGCVQLSAVHVGIAGADDELFACNAHGPIPAGEARVHVCSWCARVREDDGWHELEDAVRREDTLGALAAGPVNHGICTACLEELVTS